MLKPGGSEYPNRATLGGAPAGLPPPASPACSVSPPCGTLSDSGQQLGACPSTSYFWPIPTWSPYPPTWSRSSAIPRCPNTVRSDYTYCDKAGSTAAESACQCYRKTPPCDEEIASASHCFPGHCPFLSSVPPWPLSRSLPTPPLM